MKLPIIGIRRAALDALKLGIPLAALATLVILAGNGPPSVTSRTYALEPLELEQGGIWEQWTFDVPQQPPGLTEVRIRVKARLSAQWLRYENLSVHPETITGDPFGFINAYVPWIVDAPGMPLLYDEAQLYARTKAVSQDFDGAWDYAGTSGTQLTRTPYAATTARPMGVEDVTEWEGDGTVTVTVTAPASGITVGSIHSMEQAVSAGVFGDGVVVVEFRR